jgi:hypothetical protein
MTAVSSANVAVVLCSVVGKSGNVKQIYDWSQYTVLWNTSVNKLSTSLHVLHGNVDWLGMIPVVDNNGQEELISVYVAAHYAIVYQRLAQRQGIQQSAHFYFQAFFQ